MNPQDKDAFEELLANCADEPIRFPGAIQPHGLLLTLSEPALAIIQVSANVETLLARAPQSLIGQPLENLIGDDIARIPALAREKNAALHLYGKSEARPGRKMGHVNRIIGR